MHRAGYLLLIALLLDGCGKSSDPEQSSIDQSGTDSVKQQVQSAASAMDWPPQGAVIGRLLSQQFKPDQAILENGILTLRQGDDAYSDLQVLIFLFSSKETFANKTFKVFQTDSNLSSPSIHLIAQSDAESLPETIIVRTPYQMQLEFSEEQQNGLPFEISLSIPGKQTDTELSGSGRAEISTKTAISPVLEEQIAE